MGTAYQYLHPQYTSFDSRQDATYHAPGNSGSNYGESYNGAAVQARQYTSTSQPPPASASTLRHEVQAPSSTYSIQPPSPQPPNRTGASTLPEDVARRKSVNSDMILPNLQIPPSINDSGGSLAEFAAQVTCLFWFESTETLRKAEELSPSSSPVKRLRSEAHPSSGFRKWVVTILSTTQVTPNVILLALLFIYRLKKNNPAVKGKVGSEYRLLTVALMLGNKFLDDNTYTNKTWAEVSGISVTEIHVMEVEFLSNMRYSLLASEEQWKEWQEKLGRFWTYCDRASTAPLPQLSPRALAGQQTPLPSPPSSMQASPSSTNYYPTTSGSSYNQHYSANSGYAAPLVSPLAAMPELDVRQMARKRSYDGDVEEPAAKRLARPPSLAPFKTAMPPFRQDGPRLPVPNLTISTNQPMSSNIYTGSTNFQHNAPVLPPLHSRAMSSVYPTTPAWTPQLPMLVPSGLSGQHGAQHPNGNGYVTPSRRHSPRVQDLLSLGSSPINHNLPNHNSPSFFLQQRASPYRPVRHVNTLLYGPPSTSMHNYHATMDQMHYQPLGKRNEVRTGVVPYLQFPVLPQPNFNA